MNSRPLSTRMHETIEAMEVQWIVCRNSGKKYVEVLLARLRPRVELA